MTAVCQAPIDPLLGRTVAGRYQIAERIGHGASSAVYRALQWPLERSVAMKILSDVQARQPRSLRRFVNEARMLSKLRHPNTIRLIEFGRTEDGLPFMALDYVPGGTLRDLMRGQRLAVEPALRVAAQVAGALAEAHGHGIIHRDLKPENILIEHLPDNDLHIRLIDFGLARDGNPSDVERSSPNGPRLRVGTPGYMSPEQTFWRPVDPATDLYALGAILYEMLTGHPVFESDCRQGLYLEHLYSTPRRLAEVAPDRSFDGRLEALVMQLLAKDAAARGGSAAAVATSIEALRRRVEPADTLCEPVPPRPTEAPEPPPRLPSRWGRLHLIATALLGGRSF